MALAAGALGVVGLGASFVMGFGTEGSREVLFRSYLHNFVFFLSLALGGLFFTLVTHLTRAGWSISLRRIAEVCAWTVLPLTVLALVLLAGLHDLYEWTHADALAHDSLLRHKAPYLNTTFFVVRLAIYFLIWNLLAAFYLRRSSAQDESGDPAVTVRLEKVAAPAMIVFALTVSFVSFDLIMSLTPHWYSTIFGVYYFAGSALGFFCLVPITIFFVQRSGKLRRSVHVAHLHDMGKLIFAFVVFWAYIAFSQFFLIWYGNIPEETVWYAARQSGAWTWISLSLLVGHFVLPFLALVSSHPKRRRGVLATAAVWLLAMHWLDLFYLVMPESRGVEMPFRLLDATCFVGIGGIFVGALVWRLGRGNLVPVRDPRLGESLGIEHA